MLIYVNSTMCPAEWRRTIEQWGCVYICMWRHIVVKSVYLCVCVCVCGSPSRIFHLVCFVSADRYQGQRQIHHAPFYNIKILDPLQRATSRISQNLLLFHRMDANSLSWLDFPSHQLSWTSKTDNYTKNQTDQHSECASLHCWSICQHLCMCNHVMWDVTSHRGKKKIFIHET